jgi:hypothetical protein
MRRKTHAILANQIHETIIDFSLSLRALVEEAGRRLTDGEGDASLKKEFRHATQILTVIEHENPKEKAVR